MPKLNQITELLNERFTSVNTGHVFQRGKYYGLVTTYYDQQRGVPTIVKLDGETEDATIDDIYPVQFYHRCITAGFKPGFNENDLVSAYSMTCVVRGNRTKLRMHESDLAFMVRSAMSGSLTKTEIGTSKLSGVTIEFTSANFDGIQVFQQEYKFQGSAIEPETIYFAMNYTLTVDASRSCIVCEDCTG